MPNMYTASFSAQAVTAAVDFFELIVPSTKVAVVHEVVIGQSSDVGDAAEEILSLLFKRGVSSTTGTGGTQAATPVKLETGGASAGCTFDYLNTTKMTSGTITTLRADTWNVRGPYQWIPTPETRPVLSPSERFTVELVSAPADSLTVSATLVFEELG